MQESSCNCGKNLDYRQIAHGLQEDLRKMIFRAEELETDLNCKLNALENRLTSKILSIVFSDKQFLVLT